MSEVVAERGRGRGRGGRGGRGGDRGRGGERGGRVVDADAVEDNKVVINQEALGFHPPNLEDSSRMVKSKPLKKYIPTPSQSRNIKLLIISMKRWALH
jgi:hypothetical protein